MTIRTYIIYLIWYCWIVLNTILILWLLIFRLVYHILYFLRCRIPRERNRVKSGSMIRVQVESIKRQKVKNRKIWWYTKVLVWSYWSSVLVRTSLKLVKTGPTNWIWVVQVIQMIFFYWSLFPLWGKRQRFSFNR